eukprot:CAMPEP_0184690160 /NCGR_PEP_ID=MMETSP0312-20130426/31067_1 /TAXON_ID=31354 /ORGANISM="Compsopogon coeruleus, Strain SAG 36.94" /LENGTH=79 /DNA_ID=CAMNT_0027147609 /DNA_START=758 /DNA_END=997 /DNA_ORIENTATION=-
MEKETMSRYEGPVLTSRGITTTLLCPPPSEDTVRPRRSRVPSTVGLRSHGVYPRPRWPRAPVEQLRGYEVDQVVVTKQS